MEKDIGNVPIYYDQEKRCIDKEYQKRCIDKEHKKNDMYVKKMKGDAKCQYQY
jgi:hypothetical protein